MNKIAFFWVSSILLGAAALRCGADDTNSVPPNGDTSTSSVTGTGSGGSTTSATGSGGGAGSGTTAGGSGGRGGTAGSGGRGGAASGGRGGAGIGGSAGAGGGFGGGFGGFGGFPGASDAGPGAGCPPQQPSSGAPCAQSGQICMYASGNCACIPPGFGTPADAGTSWICL
jgi:hypothetical protein